MIQIECCGSLLGELRAVAKRTGVAGDESRNSDGQGELLIIAIVMVADLLDQGNGKNQSFETTAIEQVNSSFYRSEDCQVVYYCCLLLMGELRL